MVDMRKALLTPLIALIAVYVAFQQYRLAKLKQDVDVHERRLSIYKKTMTFLCRTERGQGISEDEYHDWELSLFEAEHLFQKEVLEHLHFIDDVASDLVHITSLIKEYPSGPITEDSADREQLRLWWAQAEAFNALTGVTAMTVEVFSPYFHVIKARHRVSKPKDLARERERLNYTSFEKQTEFDGEVEF